MFGIGVALTSTDHFSVAYAFLAVSGIWFLTWWLLSNFIHAKWTKTQGRVTRANSVAVEKARVGFCLWLIGSILLISTLTAAALWGNHYFQVQASLKSFDGWLYPGNEPDPYKWCAPKGKELAVYMNNYAAIIGKFPENLVSIDGGPVLELDRKNDGAIHLSLDVKGEDRKIVVRMNNGEFTVNRNNILKMERPSPNRLIVYDQEGSKVLDVDYMNRHSISVHAVLTANGRTYDVSKLNSFLGFMCLENSGGANMGSIVNFQSSSHER